VHLSWRAAVRYWLESRPKLIGPYCVYRGHRGRPHWTVRHKIDPLRGRTIGRNRAQLARLIREDRRVYYQALKAQPDPHAPDTLGWRVWLWNSRRKLLVSPNQSTV
jgi:hypothetical protein